MKSAYFLAREIIEKHERGESSVGDVCAPLLKKMWHLNPPGQSENFCLETMHEGHPIYSEYEQ